MGKRTLVDTSSSEVDWSPGCLNQLQPDVAGPQQQPKRVCHGWNSKKVSFSSIFHEHKGRVEDCWKQSLGVRVCNELADQLHQAMKHAPIDDHRLSEAGEKHRILTRAFAMREVLLTQDLSLSLQVDGGAACPQVQLTRSSNEAEPDATPGQCMLSVCMLLAALYEQSPYGAGSELRRKIYHDFSILKRSFRSHELQMLRGKTTSIKELFESVKAMDRMQGLDNVIGVLFEDWKVNKRVDSFILANELDVEVLTLTSDGPIGKFKCKLKTLMTLNLLHQRLIKELYDGMFAGKPAVSKQYEPMSKTDPLDFIDFTEALARNVPQKHVEGTDLFYAWMYSPEVHASPEVWAKVFKEGANTLPTLYDGVKTPCSAVRVAPEDGSYTLDVQEAAGHDYLSQGSAQAAVGFPWADDLIGAYLRKLKNQPPKPKAAPKPASTTDSKDSSTTTTTASAPTSTATKPAPQDTVIASQQGESVSIQSTAPPPPIITLLPRPAPGTHHHTRVAHAVPRAPPPPPPKIAFSEIEAQQPNTLVTITHNNAQVSMGLSPQLSWSLEATGEWKVKGEARAAATARAKRDVPVTPIPNAEESGQLVLPLGIFMVGIICSGAFTNTQIHVEDLLLMSININIFGAPKVWWWLPRESVHAFKEAAEAMTEGGRSELYTKSISPFLVDRDYGAPEHVLPLERLRDLGAKRTIQMPGQGIWTMPGYAFHFTVSMGMNVAESANMFLEVMGWTFEKLWAARPLEQYPDLEDDMARYMKETGLLAGLGVTERPPRPAATVHRELAPKLKAGRVVCNDGKQLQRAVYTSIVKYRTVPGSPASSESTATGERVTTGATTSTACMMQRTGTITTAIHTTTTSSGERTSIQRTSSEPDSRQTVIHRPHITPIGVPMVGLPPLPDSIQQQIASLAAFTSGQRLLPPVTTA